VYPNPSDGPFTLDVKEAMTLTVLDLKGSVVLERVLVKGKNELLLEHPGTYTLKLTGKDGETILRKVTRQ
jgi:hemin uptake protein HemP